MMLCRNVKTLVLQIRHDLNLLTLSMQVVKPELGARLADVVDATSKGFSYALLALACRDVMVLLDVVWYTNGNVELVRVRIR